ncbi:hypothetical protein HZC31_03720 [Candidatus Woesearchaeota archaeon]|nr:hypothetical protein [Candidatus Woesearchaeota archaeon]
MEVFTIRVQESVAKQIWFLSKELQKPQAEVIRELMSKAVKEERLQLLLKKYEEKEITLRTLAKELDIPLWKVQDLLQRITFPYGLEDVQRDLQILEGI